MPAAFATADGHGHAGKGKPQLPPIEARRSLAQAHDIVRTPPIYYWTPARSDEESANPGSVIGTEPPPHENVPNRSGQDPHGAPRATPAEQQLVSDFFAGAIPRSDDCGGGPASRSASAALSY